jgi:hypothetical protein
VGAFVLALTACGDSGDGADTTERVDSVAQAIIAGRLSGTSENATVYLEAINPTTGNRLRCTGTLVAPNLVLTARHCILRADAGKFSCLSNGELSNPADATDLRTEEPANVNVRYGADASEFVVVHGTRLFATSQVNICRNDLALILLERPLATTYTPLRMDAPRLREQFRVTGWGYTGDGQTVLPPNRWSRDDLVVAEVGPGLIPAGTFATAGNTICHGDSGAGAWFGDAVGGVDSRLDGLCEDPYARSTFTMLAANRVFLEESFAAAGVKPWYAGEPAPWLLKDGAACTSNDACLSALCTDSVCTSASAPLPAAPAPTTPPDGKGCTASRAPEHTSSFATLALVLAATLVAAVRRRNTST